MLNEKVGAACPVHRWVLVSRARHEASFTAFSHSESVTVLPNAMAHKRKGMSEVSDVGVDEEPGRKRVTKQTHLSVGGPLPCAGGLSGS